MTRLTQLTPQQIRDKAADLLDSLCADKVLLEDGVVVLAFAYAAIIRELVGDDRDAEELAAAVFLTAFHDMRRIPQNQPIQ